VTRIAAAQRFEGFGGFDQPPPPAPARPLQLPPMAQTRLSNGLSLAVAERHGLPLVTALLQIEAGSLLDPPGRAGLAALSFVLMGKGARRGARLLDAAEIAAAAERLGASLEIDTGARASHLAMTVVANRLDDSLALLADIVRAPTLAADELERSRAQSLDAIRLSLSDPGALAGLLAQRLFWGETAAGAVATPASLQRIRRDDVLAFLRRQLRPERATLVLAGDIGPERAQALAERYFGDWKPDRIAPPPLLPPTGPRPLGATTLLLDLPGAGQSAVVVVAPYAALGNEPAQRASLRAGAVANAVLGAGYSSRINQEVRIRRGLSYGAASVSEALPGGGMLTASVQTRHASAAQVLGLLRAEILRLGNEEVAAPELQARAALLVGEFGRQLETTAGLAALAAEQLLRRSLAELAQLPAELLAIDAAQLRAFAAGHWPAEALRQVVVGDLSESGPALRAQFPDAWLIPAAELDLGAANLRRAARR
jgi:zinc protease